MELPAEVLLWLEHPADKRAVPLASQNPVEALKSSLEALALAKCMMVAAFTFLMYDIALTYRREVQLIWGSRWTFVRVLFTITRYFVPCVLMFNIYYAFHPRLTAKVYFYSGSGLYGGEIFASSQLPPAILIGGELQKFTPIDNPCVLTGCVVTSQSGLKSNWVHLYISSLTYESVLFLLTLVRAWILNKRGTGTPIMTLLTRDGAWYFLVVIASVSLTAIGTSVPKTQAAALMSDNYGMHLLPIGVLRLLRLRGFYAPTDQSTGREVILLNEDISMRPYTSGKHGRTSRHTVQESRPEIVVYVTTDGTSKFDV
ncbi:hypothetical protein FRC09_011455 [Ceratobasidium sp. 395]|nr:hypothetical protein FRC09_011455 [Ceratobasidium sp. 395]